MKMKRARSTSTGFHSASLSDRSASSTGPTASISCTGTIPMDGQSTTDPSHSLPLAHHRQPQFHILPSQTIIMMKGRRKEKWSKGNRNEGNRDNEEQLEGERNKEEEGQGKEYRIFFSDLPSNESGKRSCGSPFASRAAHLPSETIGWFWQSGYSSRCDTCEEQPSP